MASAFPPSLSAFLSSCIKSKCDAHARVYRSQSLILVFMFRILNKPSLLAIFYFLAFPEHANSMPEKMLFWQNKLSFSALGWNKYRKVKVITR